MVRLMGMSIRAPFETWPILGIMGFVPCIITYFSYKSTLTTGDACAFGHVAFKGVGDARYVSSIIGDRTKYRSLVEQEADSIHLPKMN